MWRVSLLQVPYNTPFNNSSFFCQHYNHAHDKIAFSNCTSRGINASLLLWEPKAFINSGKRRSNCHGNRTWAHRANWIYTMTFDLVRNLRDFELNGGLSYSVTPLRTSDTAFMLIIPAHKIQILDHTGS